MGDGRVVRVVQLKLQATAGQAAALERLLEGQRELYNAALEERRGVWRWEQRSVTRFGQYRHLTGWDHPVLEWGVTPARGTLLRLDRAFQGFYRRCRSGAKPGFPRFKGRARFDSVEYPDTSCWKLTSDGAAGRLYVKGVGHVRYRTSRRGVVGTPKTLVVRREGRGWRAFVACVVERPETRTKTGAVVGVDLGVTELVATSDGTLVDNPRWVRAAAERLADAQRLVAGRRRGSQRRRKAAIMVGGLHRKVANQRRDHHHRLSRQLVDGYDLIVHEDLRVANMVRRPKPRPDGEGGHEPNGAAAKGGLNREIHSAGWGALLAMLRYKAEDAGVELLAVDPRHTSQTCPSCGHVDARSRTGAVFDCVACGHRDHADINAAINILRAGLALRSTREAA